MKRKKIALTLAAAAVAAIAAAPWTWLPAAASAVVRKWLDFDAPGSAEAKITRITPFRFSARGIRIGAVAGEPRISSVEARFTPWGLCRGRIRSLRAEGLGWDLPSPAPPQISPFFPATNVTGALALDWREGLGYRGSVAGNALGAPFSVSLMSDTAISTFSAAAKIAPCATNAAQALPPLVATAEAVRFSSDPDSTNATLRAKAEFGAEGVAATATATAECGGGSFSAEAKLPPTAFSSADPLLAPFLAAVLPPNAPETEFSGSFEATASVARPKGRPLPEWNAGLRLGDFSATAQIGENEASLNGGSLLFSADGLGSHFDIAPFGIRFANAAFGKYAIDKGSMWFRADKNSVLLTEGFAGFCGGTVRLYALHLNLASLDAGFTLLLDDLDAGRVLELFPKIDGTATGKMHGKLPLSIRNGSEIRLRNAYLYSPPGQIGKLRLASATVLIDRLRETGVPEVTCDSLEKALQDLDYAILRFDLAQDRATGDGKLAVRLHGTAAASAGRAATPVDLNLTFNGQLEEAVNTAIKTAGMQNRR